MLREGDSEYDKICPFSHPKKERIDVFLDGEEERSGYFHLKSDHESRSMGRNGDFLLLRTQISIAADCSQILGMDRISICRIMNYPESQHTLRKGRMLLRKINSPPQSGQ